MGIFEKIFEIGTWCINVLGACDSASAAGTPISEINPSMMGFGSSGGGIMGMDFVGAGGDLGILGLSRKGVAVDPLEFFVRTLSASPNSRTQFADRLLMFAQERPGGMRMSLSPVLTLPSPAIDDSTWNSGTAGTIGSVVGEVKEENDAEAGLPGYEMSGALGDVFSEPLPPASLSGVAVDPISSDGVMPMSGYLGAQEAPTSVPPSFAGWSAGDVGQEMGMNFQVVPTVEDAYFSHSGEASPILSRNNSGTSINRRSDQRGGVNEDESVPRMHDVQHRSSSHQDLGVFW